LEIDQDSAARIESRLWNSRPAVEITGFLTWQLHLSHNGENSLSLDADSPRQLAADRNIVLWSVNGF
jgi:hypothetical protein